MIYDPVRDPDNVREGRAEVAREPLPGFVPSMFWFNIVEVVEGSYHDVRFGCGCWAHQVLSGGYVASPWCVRHVRDVRLDKHCGK